MATILDALSPQQGGKKKTRRKQRQQQQQPQGFQFAPLKEENPFAGGPPLQQLPDLPNNQFNDVPLSKILQTFGSGAVAKNSDGSLRGLQDTFWQKHDKAKAAQAQQMQAQQPVAQAPQQGAMPNMDIMSLLAGSAPQAPQFDLSAFNPTADAIQPGVIPNSAPTAPQPGPYDSAPIAPSPNVGPMSPPTGNEVVSDSAQNAQIQQDFLNSLSSEQPSLSGLVPNAVGMVGLGGAGLVDLLSQIGLGYNPGLFDQTTNGLYDWARAQRGY